jgi:hypothetical protein
MSLTALGLLGTCGCVVPFAKAAVRRHRRRLGGPDRRTFGAWRDSLDRLIEAGVGVAPADTSGEVAAAARQRFGDGVGVPVQRLALLHDEAAFAPGSLSELAAAAAWRYADHARREIHATLRTRDRLRAALSVRPVWRRARSRKVRATGR